MTYYQHMDARKHSALSPKHEEMLFKESAIAPDVVAERGVRTVRTGRDLPRSYSWRQKKRAPGSCLPHTAPTARRRRSSAPITRTPRTQATNTSRSAKSSEAALSSIQVPATKGSSLRTYHYLAV
jgi:hypothetical protein